MLSQPVSSPLYLFILYWRPKGSARAGGWGCLTLWKKCFTMFCCRKLRSKIKYDPSTHLPLFYQLQQMQIIQFCDGNLTSISLVFYSDPCCLKILSPVKHSAMFQFHCNTSWPHSTELLSLTSPSYFVRTIFIGKNFKKK